MTNLEGPSFSVRRFRLVAASAVSAAASTAAAATTATGASSAVATATAIARTLFAWSRFIHGERSAIDLCSIKLCDSLIGILATHLNKSKALRTAGVPVRDNVN